MFRQFGETQYVRSVAKATVAQWLMYWRFCRIRRTVTAMRLIALARIGDPGGLEAVVAALNDRHETPRLRMAAAGALGNARNFGRAAVELLNRVLQDTSEIPALRGDAARYWLRSKAQRSSPCFPISLEGRRKRPSAFLGRDEFDPRC